MGYSPLRHYLDYEDLLAHCDPEVYRKDRKLEEIPIPDRLRLLDAKDISRLDPKKRRQALDAEAQAASTCVEAARVIRTVGSLGVESAEALSRLHTQLLTVSRLREVLDQANGRQNDLSRWLSSEQDKDRVLRNLQEWNLRQGSAPSQDLSSSRPQVALRCPTPVRRSSRFGHTVEVNHLLVDLLHAEGRWSARPSALVVELKVEEPTDAGNREGEPAFAGLVVVRSTAVEKKVWPPPMLFTYFPPEHFEERTTFIGANDFKGEGMDVFPYIKDIHFIAHRRRKSDLLLHDVARWSGDIYVKGYALFSYGGSIKVEPPNLFP